MTRLTESLAGGAVFGGLLGLLLDRHRILEAMAYGGLLGAVLPVFGSEGQQSGDARVGQGLAEAPHLSRGSIPTFQFGGTPSNYLGIPGYHLGSGWGFWGHGF